MSTIDDMRRTLGEIRSKPGKDGKHSPRQIAAMANLEAAIAKIEVWEAKSTELSTLEVEQFKMRADDSSYSPEQRELMKKILGRRPRRMSRMEANLLKRR